MVTKPKLIVMYYGRFQPPHKGHIGVFNALQGKFGRGNVYIATSNIVDQDKSPLSFTWKQKILRANGIPANKIIQSKKNYNAEEVQQHFRCDVKNTVFIIAVGEKDASRLSSSKYFKPYVKGRRLGAMANQGYYTIIPNIKTQGGVISATNIRRRFRKEELTSTDYGYFDKVMGITRAMVDILKPLFEDVEQQGDLIMEGGYAGHMSNIFEDHSITFSTIEDIITASLNGEINRTEITEKVDGQNLFASVKGGKVVLARNKTQIKNRDAGSMDKAGVKAKFKDKPNVAATFSVAIDGLEESILKLSKDEIDEIFDEGRNWINLEIISPTNKNVFAYSVEDIIVLHNLQIVDDSGVATGVNKKAQEKLFAKVKSIKTKKVKVLPPLMMKVKPHEDFSSKSKYFVNKLNAFRSQQKVSKNATLGAWYESYFTKKIVALEKKFGKKIPQTLRKQIIARLAWNTKTPNMKTIKNGIENAPIYDGIAEMARNIEDIYKEARKPLELLLMELGIEVLSNLETYLSANPDDTIETIRKEIHAKIAQIKGSKNIEDIAKMQSLLKKIQAVGGMDKIVPTEGIVFRWGGKTYKMTGTFSPLTGILGMGRY